jgi:flagellar biosynthesis protein FlhG
MMKDQAENLRQMAQNAHKIVNKQPKSKARVITVTGGKGGVGKTNVTINLALALADFGQKVLIIDADASKANVALLLGCSTTYTVSHFMSDGISLANVIADGPRGVKFLAGGSELYQLANLNNDQLQQASSQISLLDAWADIILIDTGAGLDRNVLNFIVAADEVVIVATPESTAITDAYTMMKAYVSQQGKAPLWLIVNRVLETDQGQLVVDKLLNVAFRFLELPINSLGLVYEDCNLLKAVEQQTPLLLSFPETISARCIEHIAYCLLNGKNLPPQRGFEGLFQKFLEMM